MLFATLLRELSSTLPRKTHVHEIHSRLDQNQRSRASDRFRRDLEPSVLVTSDVSARGVDYPGVTRVVQIGIPSSSDLYVHRVGRTGRGGKAGGRGDLLLLPFEESFVRELNKVPIQKTTVEGLEEDLKSLAASNGETAYLATLEKMQAQIDDLIPSLDEAAIEEVYTSFLGYYTSRTNVLSVNGHQVLEGLEEWCTGAAGMTQPPHLSESFLAKLGFAPRGGRGRGGRPPQQRQSRFGVTQRNSYMDAGRSAWGGDGGRGERSNFRGGGRGDEGDVNSWVKRRKSNRD